MMKSGLSFKASFWSWKLQIILSDNNDEIRIVFQGIFLVLKIANYSDWQNWWNQDCSSFWSWNAWNLVRTSGKVPDNYSQNRFHKYIHKYTTNTFQWYYKYITKTLQIRFHYNANSVEMQNEYNTHYNHIYPWQSE